MFFTMIKKHFYLISGLLLTSCATGYNPAYTFNEIQIINNSREMIQDVTIGSDESSRIFSCGNIAPRGICSDKFPARKYLQKPIRINWVFGNTARQTDAFVLEVPPKYSAEIPLRGILEISPQGSISTYFEQDTLVN